MDYNNICYRCEKEFKEDEQIFMTHELDSFVCNDCIEKLKKADRKFLNEKEKIIYDEIVVPILQFEEDHPELVGNLGATGYGDDNDSK